MIEVLKPGFYTAIQDLGRFGFQNFGVPVSGVMDSYSAKTANTILNNDENDAVLEVTMTGPTLQFKSATQICISGANISPKLNGDSIRLNTLIIVKADDVLSFGRPIKGFRCYLAVSGGFNSELKMSSRSMFKSITSSIKISKGDVLHINKRNRIIHRKKPSIKFKKTHFNSKKLDAYKGPEFDRLTSHQKAQLRSQLFAVSKHNNRMAYQLEESLENNLEPILTSLVMSGTIQLTPSGTLIILMRDCQTTGGYPRILQLSESAINSLSQKFTGETFHFRLLEYS